MPSRKVIDLDPKMQPKAMLFATRMAEEGVPFIFTSTRRTQAEQDELWAQGRTKPGRIVTRTRKSKHLLGLAFDIAVCKSGVPQWSEKVDVDEDGIPDYEEAGAIGKSCGLRWGGDFGDMPHFEWKES